MGEFAGRRRVERVLFAATSALLLAAATPPAAPEGADAVAQRAYVLAEEGRLKDALALLDRAERRSVANSDRFMLRMARGVVMRFGRGGDRAQAMAAFASAEALVPDEPVVQLRLFEMGVGSGDGPLAEGALAQLITRFPDIARALDPIKVGRLRSWMFQSGRRDDSAALAARLGRIGFGGDRIQTRDGYAMAALREDMTRGDEAAARSVAGSLTDPDTLTELLTERRYEALWPSVEARVGDGMQQPRTAVVMIAERVFAANPDDVDARLQLVDAYRVAGRPEDADKTASGFATTAEAMAGVNERGGWLINAHSRVLHGLGRHDAADARMAALLATPMAQKPWLISMAINRISGLLSHDPARGGALIGEAERDAQQFGSPYARHLIREYKVCHAAMTKQPAEAVSAAVDDLVAHEKDSPAATVRGLMCAGRADEASQRIIAMLEDDRERSMATSMFQPPAPGDDMQAAMIGDARPLLARAHVRAAFDRVGRILPKRFEHTSMVE